MIWLILVASHLIFFGLGALFVMLWEHLEWRRVEEYKNRDISDALKYPQTMEDLARMLGRSAHSRGGEIRRADTD